MKNLVVLMLFAGILFSLGAASSGSQKVIFSEPPDRQSWGPDAYGYLAKDSNEPGGPPVNWIDISAIGTPVSGLGDDNIVGPFDIGFPFRYYWYDVTSFHIGSNGYLRFSGGGQLSHPFATIPDPLPPNDIVCFYAADFDPSTSGNVYYWTNGIDSLIVSFDDVPAWSTGGPTGSHDFQVILSMVDTSITFNYGPQIGTFYDNDGVVGIENTTGNLGIECYANNVIPSNYSIKFYYPQSTTFEVHDISVQRVQNDISGGFILQTNDNLQVNATIQNTGNQHEGDFYVIAEWRQYPSNTLLESDSVYVDTLQAGQSYEVNFNETWTMNTPGDYVVRVRSTLAGDMVITNDRKDVELHVVDIPGPLYFDDNSSEQLWSWSGGQGGMALRYEPPVYPAKIMQMLVYLGSGTQPVTLQILDDDGPNGEPGTVLADTQFVAATEDWYTIFLTGVNVVVPNGAFYVFWKMNGSGSPGLGMDDNSMGSRQAWEYTGVWATFRNAETSDPMLRVIVEQTAQTVFFDDFEGGPGNWTGDWALTTEASYSPSHSYTDSPNSNYPNNATLLGEMASGVDLSNFLGATLEFYTKYELETGFDYCYLEVSDDGGATWHILKTYNGEGVVTQFTQQIIDLGGFAGESDVRIRFRLVTDAGYQTDGMYVDDLKIIGLTEDTSPPLMAYDPPLHYEGVPDSLEFPVKITDLSGVANASLTYWIDNDLPTQYTVGPTTVSNDTFYFMIPQQEAGSLVSFYVEASDNALPPNTAVSDTMNYLAGWHIIYDDGEAEYIVELNAGDMIATKMNQPPQFSYFLQLTTVLLRIYTDTSHPIDSVTVHVWADSGGLPGADLIPPFKKHPDATLQNPQAWTLVDLRSFQLEPGLTFWVGYELPANLGMAQLYDSPPVYNRSYVNDGAGWNQHNGDFHIRCVMGTPPVGIQTGKENLVPEEFVLRQNYPNPFNPATVIPYAIPEHSEVTIEIFNILGERVATLKNELQPPGYYKVTWKPQNLSTGIYLCRLTASGINSGKTFRQVKKLILMR